MEKIRRVDYWPDEMIAGVVGQLSPEDFGVYWMICTLVYSHGGAITDDAQWISGIFKKTNPRTIRAALDRLVDAGKVVRSDGELMVNRCRTELERASKRIRIASENGSKGGRPSSKNNDLAKPEGFSGEKLTKNKERRTKNEEESTPCSPPPGDTPPDGGSTDRDLLGEAPHAGSRKRSAGPTRGTRVPDGDLPDEWAAAANHSREKHQLPLLSRRVLGLRWDAFQNYWRGVAGSKGLKLDWRATWLNDAIDSRTERRFPPDAGAAAERPAMIDTTG